MTGIRSVVFACLLTGNTVLATDTQFFVHYLPWMTGPNSDHWCDTDYGNSYYGSVIGQWSCEDIAVLEWQAKLMKTAGISGVFFDFQMISWRSCVDKMVSVLKSLGLQYAIMPDTAEGDEFLTAAMPWIRQRMQDSNYARFENRSLLPVFDFAGDKAPSVDQLRAGLGDVVIVSRLQPPQLEGADHYYPWISGSDANSLRSYYENPPAGTRAIMGGVWRGFEACYSEKQVYLDHYANSALLQDTVRLAKEYKPAFAQIMTWDDYTEGTMIEPSFLIRNKINNCNSIDACSNGAYQGFTLDCSLPFCADGYPCNLTSPFCLQCNDGGICSPYRDLIQLYKELVDPSQDDTYIEALFAAIEKPPGAPFGAKGTSAKHPKVKATSNMTLPPAAESNYTADSSAGTKGSNASTTAPEEGSNTAAVAVMATESNTASSSTGSNASMPAPKEDGISMMAAAGVPSTTDFKDASTGSAGIAASTAPREDDGMTTAAAVTATESHDSATSFVGIGGSGTSTTAPKEGSVASAALRIWNHSENNSFGNSSMKADGNKKLIKDFQQRGPSLRYSGHSSQASLASVCVVSCALLALFGRTFRRMDSFRGTNGMYAALVGGTLE